MTKHNTVGLSETDRFMSYVSPEPNCGCWLWLGAGVPDGYGNFEFRGRTRVAHRVAYEMFVRKIPSGLQLDHLCRVRCCVNPAHLEPVTHTENAIRGLSWNRSKTHCTRGYEYAPENTYSFVIRRPNGKTCIQRRCKACRALQRASNPADGADSEEAGRG